MLLYRSAITTIISEIRDIKQPSASQPLAEMKFVPHNTPAFPIPQIIKIIVSNKSPKASLFCKILSHQKQYLGYHKTGNHPLLIVHKVHQDVS